jgi:dipeptidyl aminopeptidase/acylaminoacyl peptidase
MRLFFCRGPRRCRRSRRTPPVATPARLRLSFLLVLLIVASAARAASEVRSGATISVSNGNGLLAVDVDAVASISGVHIDRIGSMFGGTTLTGLAGGTNIRLIELPAGDYRWSRIDLPGRLRYLHVRDDARFHFRVEPGSINYAGDLCVTLATGGSERYAITVTNRAARMLVHLDRTWPGARRSYPLRYAGPSPDHFLQFAANELGDQLATDALKAGSAGALTEAAGADPALQVLVGELFAAPQVRTVHLNPNGNLVAAAEYRDGKHRISVIDAQTQTAVDVYAGTTDVRKLYFADDRTLLYELNLPGGNGNYIAHVAARPDSAPAFSQHVIPGRGWFLDPPLDDGTALYARVGTDGSQHIFRISLAGERFDSSQFAVERRLDRGLDKAFYGLADGSGVLRFALTSADGGDYAAMYRADAASPWREVQRYAADEEFQPVMLAADGASVVAVTNKGRAQKDLVRIALPGGAAMQTLYSIAGTDIDGVLMRNGDRRVLGVLAYRDGSLETHYLDEPDAALRAAVAQVLPGKSVAIYDTSKQRDRMLVLASDEVDRGAFYLYDAASATVRQLLSIQAPMPHVRAVRSSVVKSVAADGTPIESYLTLPPDRRPSYPLIVMPHGGPIGIRDNLRFDPEVQLLANRGYAVLRVNYRGSGGFGRAFEQAGLGAWGRSIEDDVLTAIDVVLTGAPIDRDRIGLRGASYGGYSTLMGLIRTPERFRCGVAASAVTDVPLLFTSSDWSQDERSRVRMMQVVGDPATALPEMEAVSPDYQYRRLDRPLLVVHGARDTRVPLEHALRLLLLLGHAQQPPQSLFLAHEGHSIDDPEARLQAEAAIDRFFAACLVPHGAATAAAPD